MAATFDEEDVPQTKPLTGMQMNHAGGFSFVVDDMTRLRRFLCLGSETGTYYCTAKKLTRENAAVVERLLATRGAEVVKLLIDFSESGRLAKQDPLIFAFAAAIRLGLPEVRQAAYAALERVCRIPTTLFQLIENCEQLGSTTGWGRVHRKAIAKWYNNRQPDQLVYQMTKYQQRNGWSHRDILRLCHAKPSDKAHDLLFKYACKGWEAIVNEVEAIEKEAAGAAPVPTGDAAAPASAATTTTATYSKEFLAALDMLRAVEAIKTMTSDTEIAELIRAKRLAREHIPTQHLTSKAVWEALLEHMPMTALLRSLNKLTGIGLFENNKYLHGVTRRLTDVAQLQRARIHPLNVLLALKTYERGRGDKGSLTWQPVTAITDALDQAYYLAFKNVEPTGKRFVIAVDVSGSMSSPVHGSGVLSCRDAAAALAMVTVATEPKCTTVAFCHELVKLNVNPSMKLAAVSTELHKSNFGATDCAKPMTWALETNIKADVFVVITDNETYFGSIHPSEALKKYRAATGLEARLIVIGMTATNFTIADPNDAGMLDIAGFDSAAPEIIRSFVMGEI